MSIINNSSSTNNTSNGSVTLGTWLSGNSGQITVSTGTQYTMTYSSLSPEEQKELDMLEAEYNSNLKAAKLLEFKKLPKELRQWVVDYITWQKVSNQVSQAHIDKSPRQIELENKKNGFGQISIQSWIQQYSTLSLPMPAGLSYEDIETAHLEASLEEQMIDSE